MFDIVLRYRIERQNEICLLRSAHMEIPTVLGPEKKSLSEFTAEQRKAPAINWYRTPISSADMKALHKKSDTKGFIQTVGFLAIWLATASISLYSAVHWTWWITLALVFIHGTVTNFMINAVHELGHGTVFQTKKLNEFFCGLFSFLGWLNFETFQASHTRHHRYTLHPPDDLEVVLPTRLMIRHFILHGFVNPEQFWGTVKNFYRIARGGFQGEWEMTLYPETAPDKRTPPRRWAWTVLIGHGLITVVSQALGWWMVPIVVSLAPFYGGWLFFLCNNTQHIGLQDNVPDFRLCCRTFTLNPLTRFLYWQMNYHTEHHMYAAVPCYNLQKLHTLIKHDLPPCPAGLWAVWKEIAAIQAKQDIDPNYQHQAPLPHPYLRS